MLLGGDHRANRSVEQEEKRETRQNSGALFWPLDKVPDLKGKGKLCWS